MFLGRYRFWRQRSRDARNLTGLMSGIGRYDLANALFEVEAILKDRANSYRVDLADEVADYQSHLHLVEVAEEMKS